MQRTSYKMSCVSMSCRIRLLIASLSWLNSRATSCWREGCDVDAVADDDVIGCHDDDRCHVVAASSRWRQRRHGSRHEHHIDPRRCYRGTRKFLRQTTGLLSGEPPHICFLTCRPVWDARSGQITLHSSWPERFLSSVRATGIKREQFNWREIAQRALVYSAALI